MRDPQPPFLEEDEGIDAFHGSPHDFQRFDMSKVGTGEGSQSFGHGLYLAESEPLAKSYRDRLAKEGPSSGQSLADAFSLSPEQYGMMDENDLSKHMEDIKQNAEQTLFDRGKIKHVFNDLSFTTDEGDQIRAGQKEKGHMYAVKIKTKPENLLDWDAKFSEQPENIRRAIDEALSEAEDTSGNKKFMKGKFWGALGEEENKSYRNYGHLTGAALHHMLSKVYKPEELSQLLHSFGVKGIRYLDQNSRQNREGTRNYVIFDDKLVDIKRKYEQGGNVESLTQDVYHGTRSDFGSFQDNPSEWSMSRALGTHVAVDPAISSSDLFTKSKITGEPAPGANVMPLKTFPLDKFYKVYQPYHEDIGKHQTDDIAIRNEILHHGYTNDKAQFIKDVMEHRKYDRATAEKAYKALTSGKGWGEGDGGLYPTIRSFVNSYQMQPSNPKDREKMVKSFRDHLRSQGYVGVKYINTSPIETKNAEDPTSLVVFPEAVEKGQQYPLRGRFAKNDPLRSHEPDIMASKGGIVRPKRSTGGRIPEMDKLFKRAKKYVDEQTKPMLGLHDDVIVKALHIAKKKV